MKYSLCSPFLLFVCRHLNFEELPAAGQMSLELQIARCNCLIISILFRLPPSITADNIPTESKEAVSIFFLLNKSTSPPWSTYQARITPFLMDACPRYLRNNSSLDLLRFFPRSKPNHSPPFFIFSPSPDNPFDHKPLFSMYWPLHSTFARAISSPSSHNYKPHRWKSPN